MSPDTETISVIIPAYNESSGISQLIKEIKSELFEAGYSFEILVIDDGSTDDTVINAKQEHVTVIQHPHNLGNGAAIKTGIRNAKGEIIVMLDADGQHPPKDIPRLIEKIDKFDIVLLSMGEDGHIASLFPNHVYPEDQMIVVEHDSPKPPKERVSMSYKQLNRAHYIFKLIIGESKQKAVTLLQQNANLPITRVNGDCEKLYFSKSAIL